MNLKAETGVLSLDSVIERQRQEIRRQLLVRIEAQLKAELARVQAESQALHAFVVAAERGEAGRSATGPTIIPPPRGAADDVAEFFDRGQPVLIVLKSPSPGAFSEAHEATAPQPAPSLGQKLESKGLSAVALNPNPNGTPEAYAKANPFPKGRW